MDAEENTGGTAVAVAEENERGAEARRESTRELILEAARKALVQMGYEGITTRRIAEEAGVNIATLHYYFGTKELLLTETVRFALTRTQEMLRASIAAAPSAPQALVSLFATVWKITRERPGILRYDLVVRAFRDENARAQVQQIYTIYRQLVIDILEWHRRDGGVLPEHISIEHLAYVLVASVDGVVMQYLATGNTEAARAGLILLLRYALSLMEADGAESVIIGE